MSRRLFATKCGSISLLWNHMLELKMFVSDQTWSKLSVKRRSAVMVVIYIYIYMIIIILFFFLFWNTSHFAELWSGCLFQMWRSSNVRLSSHEVCVAGKTQTPQPDARRVSVDAVTLCDVRWKQISHRKRKMSHAFFCKLICCVFTLNENNNNSQNNDLNTLWMMWCKNLIIQVEICVQFVKLQNLKDIKYIHTIKHW